METAFLKTLVDLRHDLHKCPEVSGEEFTTHKKIRSFLKKLGCPDIRVVASTGLMCVFDSGEPGPTILIRGDMDALPIQEVNEFNHRSQNEGVGHECGHDGHSTILCGLAKELLDEPIEKGKVLLVFQPAEENGEGAKAVLADSGFEFEPDYAFALHNLPGYPLHEVVFKEGNFTAAAKSIIIKLEGKTSHAAEPELGNNPALAIGQIVQMFAEVSRPDYESDDFALATPICIKMGELAYGTSAGCGEVHYTLRSWDNDVMAEFVETIEKRIKEIASDEKLKVSIDWTQEFAANFNDEEAVEQIMQAAEGCKLKTTKRNYPFKWGEDFGLFTEKFKGAMFGIGSGENCPALHNPDYDFPDDIIPTGVCMFQTIIKNLLK